MLALGAGRADGLFVTAQLLNQPGEPILLLHRFLLFLKWLLLVNHHAISCARHYDQLIVRSDSQAILVGGNVENAPVVSILNCYADLVVSRFLNCDFVFGHCLSLLFSATLEPSPLPLPTSKRWAGWEGRMLVVEAGVEHFLCAGWAQVAIVSLVPTLAELSNHSAIHALCFFGHFSP